MLITRILNKLGRTYSDILNFTTTQSEFIPRLAGLAQYNLKAKMPKKTLSFCPVFLDCSKDLIFNVSSFLGTYHILQRLFAVILRIR